MDTASLRRIRADDLPRLREHLRRHRQESRVADGLFMPFDAKHPGPSGPAADALQRPPLEPGWEAWFGAEVIEAIVGHVNLKGDALETGLHRCKLGIGIERAYRGRGLGRRLLATAIEFARSTSTLAWIDLRVFAHNARARALYRRAGFVEVGTLEDRFRIDGEVVADVIMTLRL